MNHSPDSAMQAALAQAHSAMFVTAPNPRVGCVLVDALGQELGVGATQRAGGAHAEIMALRDAAARGHKVRGATAYVTLEPCAHQGRTGPCCDAFVAAGVARVVASLEDPNPHVAGAGFARLRAAGVDVTVGPGAQASRELNIGFFSRMLHGVPWLRLKIAASLDGVTALSNGRSQWITGPQARSDGHAWRARACAIVTGVGTVLADNPRLDVRDVPTDRQPALVVIDSRLQTPPDAALFSPQRQVLIYYAQDSPLGAAGLQAKGAVLIPMPSFDGKVDLAAMKRDLGRREFNEVHVEAGAMLNGALLREGLVDEVLAYLAPTFLGTGRGMAQLDVLNDPAQGLRFVFRGAELVGADLRILARALPEIALS